MSMSPDHRRDTYRKANVQEDHEVHTHGVKISQKECIPNGIETHSEVFRRLEFHNRLDGRTVTAVMVRDSQGPYGQVSESTEHMTFGVEHLDDLIGKLTEIRDDQARRKAEEDAWWAAQEAGAETELSAPKAWRRIHAVLGPLLPDHAYRCTQDEKANMTRVFVASGDLERTRRALAQASLGQYVDVRVGQTPAQQHTGSNGG